VILSGIKTPELTFDKNGTLVLLQLITEGYNITFRDKKQPLLISTDRPRERRTK